LRDLAAAASSRSGVIVHSSVALGRPVDAIVERAERAELVVLGTHQSRHLDRARLNTLAARIAGRSPVSTVVVPHSTAQGRGIVVGVDDSATSAAPIAFAAREADRLGEKLTVVHSWNAPRPWSDGEIPGWPATEEDEERRVLAECVAGLAQDYPDLPVQAEVVFGRAAEVLYDLARGARMLVVGSHGRQGFEKAWLGSTSEDLVLAAPTTVAVIR
jgi:nucleotide-binding universal stress UspA family protein